MLPNLIMRKLNLGCGYDKIPGYENVDSAPECSPDRVVDLERFPWPWADSSVEEVLLTHTLEHLGREPEVYIGIWKELWRISVPGARIHIAVPHPRHDNFAHDPTHVRAVTPESLALFDQELHPQGLGVKEGIDFRLIPESVEFFYVAEAAEAVKQGRLSVQALEHLRARQYNVSNEIRMTLEARKPALNTL